MKLVGNVPQFTEFRQWLLKKGLVSSVMGWDSEARFHLAGQVALSVSGLIETSV